MKFILTTLLFIIAGTGILSAREVPFQFYIDFYPKTERPAFIEIKLLNKGKVIYSFKYKDMVNDTTTEPIMLHDTLYEIKYTYGFPAKKKSFEHMLKLTGNVKETNAEIYISADTMDIKINKVVLKYTYPSEGKAALIRYFDPAINTIPVYKIVNLSDGALFGYRSNHFFWGTLYTYNGSFWENAAPGSICGTLGYPPPLMPGDTTDAFIPDYFHRGNNNIPSLGQYRFIVPVSNTSTDFLLAYRGGNSILEHRNVYEITDEFEVTK